MPFIRLTPYEGRTFQFILFSFYIHFIFNFAFLHVLHPVVDARFFYTLRCVLATKRQSCRIGVNFINNRTLGNYRLRPSLTSPNITLTFPSA